ncbi:MAG: amidohydrolase family protein [Armatimonadetes bacterium]|nr:amidohydrolase family protein [Armatimonadota bacterium]
MSSLRSELLQLMAATPTVDCHAHTRSESEYYDQGPYDLFTLGSYFDREIGALSGQFPGRYYDREAPDEERWQHLKAIVDRCFNESYWRHNLVTYRDLFGFEGAELDDSNWQALNDSIRHRTADRSWYRDVTVNRANVRTQVKNIPWFEDWDPAYFTPILRMEPALEIYRPGPRRQLEERVNRGIHSLRDLREALTALVEEFAGRGAVGIKLAHAYRRTLESRPVAEVTAAMLLDRALRGEALPWAEARQLEDYVIFFLAGLCTDRDLIFDIHTGVQGNGCWIPDSNPLLLLNLIQAFPRTRFNLYHGGYPWSREIGMMAKHCSNVWLNMAWMYVIGMEVSRQSLSEWLDLAPGYRILGFGSDVGFPEFVYGHLVMARSCVADVLATKVERDFLSEAGARRLAVMLMHDNAAEFYRLEA